MKQFLARYFLLTLTFCIAFKPYMGSKPLLLLSAQGDAQTPGRTIKDSCERDQGHAFAQALGKYLHAQGIYSLALTHNASDNPEPWRLIALSNTFNPDMFLKIYLNHELSKKPRLSLFYLTFNPLTEAAHRSSPPGSLIPLKKAHFGSLQTTKLYATCLKTYLEGAKYQKRFTLGGPYGIPISSLIGITAPALAIEIGISSPGQWKELVKPLARGLSLLIKPDKQTLKP